MALPPSSTMRATLRANSSTSTEASFTGSDGALTVTPQIRGSGVGPHGLASEMGFTPGRRTTDHRPCRVERSPGTHGRRPSVNLALVILRYYSLRAIA